MNPVDELAKLFGSLTGTALQGEERYTIVNPFDIRSYVVQRVRRGEVLLAGLRRRRRLPAARGRSG